MATRTIKVEVVVSSQSQSQRLITITESHFDLSVFVKINQFNNVIPLITSHKQLISQS